jgi:hypothetical protein
VSHECDHPPEVAGLPALTSSRLGDGGSSGRIDRSVRELLQAVRRVDAELAVHPPSLDTCPYGG